MKKVVAVISIFVIISLAVYVMKPRHAAPSFEIQAEAANYDYLDAISQNMVGGGPEKDGIPSIDTPKYVSASDAGLSDDDVVFGWVDAGQPKAYPKRIMYWHEIVNDGDTSITYCPLTGTVLAFRGFNLGVSGKLYNSNLVMYDRATGSEIPQILGTAVNGPLKGESLQQDVVVRTTWRKWKAGHPDTLVLSPEQGIYSSSRYEKNPYPGYEDLLRVWFPVAAKSDRFSSKKVVTGVIINGTSIAVLKEKVAEQGGMMLEVNGEEARLVYDNALDVVRVYAPDELPSTEVFWFAWYAYHPDTLVVP